jgi:hypothetical protein
LASLFDSLEKSNLRKRTIQVSPITDFLHFFFLGNRNKFNLTKKKGSNLRERKRCNLLRSSICVGQAQCAESEAPGPGVGYRNVIVPIRGKRGACVEEGSTGEDLVQYRGRTAPILARKMLRPRIRRFVFAQSVRCSTSFYESSTGACPFYRTN